jgi:hypothetical protein
VRTRALRDLIVSDSPPLFKKFTGAGRQKEELDNYKNFVAKEFGDLSKLLKDMQSKKTLEEMKVLKEKMRLDLKEKFELVFKTKSAEQFKKENKEPESKSDKPEEKKEKEKEKE